MTFRNFLALRGFLRRLIGQARGSRTIGLVGAGIVLSIVVFTVLILHENDDLAQASAEEHAVRMTKTVAYQLTATLTTIDRAMRYASAEIAKAGTAERFTDLGANGQLPTHLLAEFFFAAPDGRILASAMGSRILASPSDITNRDYFRSMLGSDDRGTTVSRPIIALRSGKRLLPVSRAVRDAKGRLMGVLVAFLDVKALGRAWDDMGLLPQDSVELIGSDGKLWVRWPEVAAVGVEFDGEGSGTRGGEAGAGPAASTATILWAQRMGEWQLTIAGGLDVNALDRKIGGAQLVIVAAALIVCLLVILFSVLLARRTRQAVRERAVARQERDVATALRQRLLTALDAVPVDFLEFDSRHRLVLANRAAREGSPWVNFDAHIGKTRTEMLRATARHFSGEDPERDWKAWMDLRLRQFERGGVFEVQRANGDWWQVSVGLQPDGSRILIRTDITELKTRMERLDSVFQSTGGAILLLNHDGRVVMANQAVLDLHGLMLSEIVGKSYTELRFSGFDAAVLERWQRDAAPHAGIGSNSEAGGMRLRAVEFECGVAAASGDRHVFRFTATPVEADTGGLRYVVLIGVDDTQRRRAEVRLFDASRLSNLGEMASGIAHEINQPLAVIRLAADALHEELEMPEAAALAGELGDFIRQKLERIISQTERAAGIISDLRTVARKPTNNVQPFDLSEAARVGGDLLREQLKLARINVKLDLAVPGPLVLGEANRVQQIVINLMLNARDAILSGETPSDGSIRGHLVLRVAADPVSGGGVLMIEDDGPGIPTAALSRLFEPFFTTKPVGKGTGLGLSISYDIVSRMGGEISAENRPEGGARFRIVLPPLPAAAD
jgi:PAS domain S-box-containing protein